MNFFSGIFEPIFDVDLLFVDQHRRIRLQQYGNPNLVPLHQSKLTRLHSVRLPQPQSEVQPQVQADSKHFFSRVKPLFAVIGKKVILKKSFRKGNGTVDQPTFPCKECKRSR